MVTKDTLLALIKGFHGGIEGLARSSGSCRQMIYTRLDRISDADMLWFSRALGYGDDIDSLKAALTTIRGLMR